MNLHFFRSKMAILSLGFLVSIAQTSHAEIKAATVSVDQLISKYHLAIKRITVLKGGRAEYLKVRSERQKKLGELSAEIKSISNKLKSKAMPRAETTNLKEQGDELISQYKSLSKDLKESDLAQVDATKQKIAKATVQLLGQIHVVIQQYAKDNGYHWIIDTSGNTSSQISPLIYARNAADVTEEILAILNKDAPKEVEKINGEDEDPKR